MKNFNEFYPTPVSLLDKITAGMDWNKIDTILEPEAGKGDIVEYLRSIDEDLDFDIDCIENEPELALILKGKGYRVIHDDFLTFNGRKKYDLIIMNPPFSNGDEHLLKALDLQRDGGYILCILNAETLRNDYTNRRKELKQKLTDYNAEITYLFEEFLADDAERKTSVDIAVVKVRIPKKANTSIILDGLKKTSCQEIDVDKDVTDLAIDDHIRAIIKRYEMEIEASFRLIDEYYALEPYMLMSLKDNCYNSPILELKIANDSSCKHPKNTVLRMIRSKYWEALFKDPRFVGGMTSEQRKTYSHQVEELANYDFSFYNIKTIQEQMARNIVKGIEECILSLFDELSHEYSWLPESGKNIHYYNGWASNKAHIVNNKVIIPLRAWDDIYNKFDFVFRVKDRLCDIEKVFDYLNGTVSDHGRSLFRTLDQAEKDQQSKNIRCRYFELTFYKKGTCHIRFLNEELLKKFNIFGGRGKAWLPPCYGKKDYKDMTAEEQSVIDQFEGKESYSHVYAHANTYLYSGQTTLSLMMSES